MYYRLYFLDQTNQIEDVAPFESECDETAILIAQQRAAGRPIELWNQDRLVTRSALVPG
jgi:hypothetical protein